MTHYYYSITGAVIGFVIGLIITCVIQHKRNKAYKHQLLLTILKSK